MAVKANDPKVQENVSRMYREGCKVDDILSTCKISPSTLYSILAKRGIVVRNATRSYRGDIKKALDMYRKGEAITNILKVTQVSFPHLYTEITLRGIPLRHRSHGGPEMAQVKKKAVEMYLAGHTMVAIARALKIQSNVIYQALYTAGVTQGRRGTRRIRDFPQTGEVKISEIARFLGVTMETAFNWSKNPAKNFPQPFARGARGRSWYAEAIRQWAKNNTGNN